MKIQTREGVVLTSICGEHVLVASMSAREYCPSITQINEEAAFIWKQAELGNTADQICQKICTEFETDDSADVPLMVETCINQFRELGLII